MPKSAALAASILIPASGLAAMTALKLLAEPDVVPFLWPIIIPALVPPLVTAFCFWVQLPAMREAVPAGFAAGIVWGATLLLCVSIMPMAHMRRGAIEQQAALRTKWAAEFSNLPANSPLWDWTPFLATRDETRMAAVLDRIRRLDRRQRDAEIMLDRGDFPLRYLGSFDLNPTPALCDKARNLLRRRVQPLIPKIPNSRPYADIAEQVADAGAAMDWLVGYDCPCDAESLAWEAMARSYRDAELGEAEALVRGYQEAPGRVAMLAMLAQLRRKP